MAHVGVRDRYLFVQPSIHRLQLGVVMNRTDDGHDVVARAVHPVQVADPLGRVRQLHHWHAAGPVTYGDQWSLLAGRRIDRIPNHLPEVSVELGVRSRDERWFEDARRFFLDTRAGGREHSTSRNDRHRANLERLGVIQGAPIDGPAFDSMDGPVIESNYLVDVSRAPASLIVTRR